MVLTAWLVKVQRILNVQLYIKLNVIVKMVMLETSMEIAYIVPLVKNLVSIYSCCIIMCILIYIMYTDKKKETFLAFLSKRVLYGVCSFRCDDHYFYLLNCKNLRSSLLWLFCFSSILIFGIFYSSTLAISIDLSYWEWRFYGAPFSTMIISSWIMWNKYSWPLLNWNFWGTQECEELKETVKDRPIKFLFLLNLTLSHVTCAYRLTGHTSPVRLCSFVYIWGNK